MKFTNKSSKSYINFCDLKENDLFVQLSDGWVFQKRSNISGAVNAWSFYNNNFIEFNLSTKVVPVELTEIKYRRKV